LTRSISAQVRSGVKLTFVTTLVAGLVQASLMVILSRLLQPADYGLYAAAMAVANLTTGLTVNVLERTLIIDTQDATPPAATATMILLSVAMVALTTFAIMLAIKQLTDWPMPPGVLGALLAAHLLSSLAVVPRVMLRRKLLFRRIVLGELASQVVAGGILSVTLAATGWGAQGLALAQVGVQLVILLSVVWGSVLRFGRVTLRQLGGFIMTASHIGRIAALEMANGQVPPLALTAMTGPVSLGLFNRANSLVQLPIQLLTTSMTRVMISALVHVIDDRERLRSGMARLVGCAAAIVTPVAFGIAGSNRAFTGVVLGTKWLAAAPLMPFLAISVWAVMMGYLFSVLSEANRNFTEKVRIQTISTVALIAGMFLFFWLGLIGAAIGMACAGAIHLFLYMRLGARILDHPLRKVVDWLRPGLAAGALCFALTAALAQLLGDWSPFLLLPLQIACCGVATLLYYALFQRTLLNEIAANALPDRLRTKLFRRPVAGTNAQ
jgi:O-antigen/teichoic acid export membrane protein